MDDFSALTGHWQIVTAELAGEKMPELITHQIELELGHGTYTVRFKGEIADQGTYTFGDPSGVQSLQLEGVTGTNAGRTIPAIYRFQGSQLQVCYGLDGQLPATFASKSGSAQFLATYRRKP